MAKRICRQSEKWYSCQYVYAVVSCS